MKKFLKTLLIFAVMMISLQMISAQNYWDMDTSHFLLTPSYLNSYIGIGIESPENALTVNAGNIESISSYRYAFRLEESCVLNLGGTIPSCSCDKNTYTKECPDDFIDVLPYDQCFDLAESDCYHPDLGFKYKQESVETMGGKIIAKEICYLSTTNCQPIEYLLNPGGNSFISQLVIPGGQTVVLNVENNGLVNVSSNMLVQGNLSIEGRLFNPTGNDINITDDLIVSGGKIDLASGGSDTDGELHYENENLVIEPEGQIMQLFKTGHLGNTNVFVSGGPAMNIMMSYTNNLVAFTLVNQSGTFSFNKKVAINPANPYYTPTHEFEVNGTAKANTVIADKYEVSNGINIQNDEINFDSGPTIKTVNSDVIIKLGP